MLINIRISELLSNTIYTVALAIITSIFFLFSLCFTIPYNIEFISNKLVTLFNPIFFNISSVTNSIWDASLSVNNHIISIGNILYTSHSIWLMLISIILLLAMVGSIILVIRQPITQQEAKSFPVNWNKTADDTTKSRTISNIPRSFHTQVRKSKDSSKNDNLADLDMVG